MFPTLWDHLLYLVMHVISVYLKLIDCHIFLQQRCVYLGSAEHCNLGSEIEVNHLQVPIRQCFYREKNYVGRAIVNRVHDFSLTVTLPGEKKTPSSVRLYQQGHKSTLFCFPTLFNWDFHLLVFYESESESRSIVSDSMRPHGLYSSWNSPGQNTGVGCLFLLQGIFPTQGSNSGLPHCRLSHKASPFIDVD